MPLVVSRSHRRLLICLLALPLGLLLAELGLSKFWIDAGRYSGPPLPPFEIESNPILASWIDKQLALDVDSVERRACGVFDPELGWDNREGKARSGNSGVHINELGARALEDFDSTSTPGMLRLACFGDSFTFCSEVSQRETWPMLLAEKSTQLEVMNFGVAGYGLDQSLLRFRRLRGQLNAHVVVIGLQLDGIGRNVHRCRPLLATVSRLVFVKPRFRLDGEELVLVPLPFEDRAAFLRCASRGELADALSEHEYFDSDAPLLPGSSLLRLRRAKQATRKRARDVLWDDKNGEPYRLTCALLQEFRAAALGAGAERVVLMLFPDRRDRELRSEVGVPYLEPLHGWLRERRWDYIDLDALLVEDLSDPEQLFVTTHFNAKGNDMAAQALHSWLSDHLQLDG